MMEIAGIRYLELDRFMGLWYEIASIAYFTQRRCVGNTTAEYTTRDDGYIQVRHACQCRDGSQTQTTGIARVIDPLANAKWEVSFLSLFGTDMFWDDFWVLDVGQQYEYALIGIPSRRRGWLLARQPHIAEPTVAKWLGLFAQFGYDIKSFRRTKQTMAVA